MFAEDCRLTHQIIAIDDVINGFRCSHANRIRAECATMFARDEKLGQIGAREHHADRESATERLAEREDIRLHNFPAGIGEVLITIPATGATAAGPDFVENQRDLFLITNLAHLRNVARRIEVHTAFALDRLHQNRRGFIINRGKERVDIAGFHLRESRRHRFEAFFHFRITGRGDHRERSAMKAAMKRNHFPSLGRMLTTAQAGEFHGRFIRFHSGMAEERLPGEGGFIEPLAHAKLRGGIKSIANRPHRLRLFRHSANQIGMAVPENSATEAGEEIDVAFTVVVPKIGTFAARHDDGNAGVVADENLLALGDDLCGGGHRVTISFRVKLKDNIIEAPVPNFSASVILGNRFMSTQLRWGILGTGNIAKQFAAAFGSARRSVLGSVGSRSLQAAQDFGANYKIPRRFGSYDEVLDDREVDAIYISLPNSMHHEWTIKSLEAGKHVLCEKPLAMDENESRAMFEAARKNNRVLMEAFMYRCHPLTHAVQETIRSGGIGEVRAIRTSFCYRTTRVEGNVRFQRQLGGGGLMDVGCYCLSFSRLIAGAEPIAIHGQAHFHETGVDDVASAVLTFPSQLLASFICGMSLQADNTATICGSEGYIEIPIPWKPPVKGATYVIAHGMPPRMDAGAKAAPVNPRETRTIDAPMELYALEADDFAATVLGGQSARITREDSLGNMRALDELRRQIGLSFK